jgi:DNA-damage-inducible protein J
MLSLGNKSAFVRARIAPQLKIDAERVLHDLGITPTQAVTMLYKAVVRSHEWPVSLKIPNAETKKALDETDRGEGVTECKDIQDLFDKLEI